MIKRAKRLAHDELMMIQFNLIQFNCLRQAGGRCGAIWLKIKSETKSVPSASVSLSAGIARSPARCLSSERARKRFASLRPELFGPCKTFAFFVKRCRFVLWRVSSPVWLSSGDVVD
jgi:hypothetical protein